MVGWLDLTSNEAVFDKQLGQLQAAPGERQLVALRHVAEAEAYADWLANPTVAVNLKKSQLPFDLLIRTRNLKAAAILVEQCPNVTFVVDHMAKPDVSGEVWKDEEEWKNGMKQLASLKNVHCKVSGFYSGKLFVYFFEIAKKILKIFFGSRIFDFSKKQFFQN